MHFPAMELKISNTIVFFEADRPGVQRILVRDNTNYNPSYATSPNEPPITKSLYTQISVPFNSVDRDIDVSLQR